MPPHESSPPARLRNISAAAQALAMRLQRHTAERVTVGNTPLHILRLCDVQYLAPLLASCATLTNVTVHLRYVASATALEALLRAAAASPTLTTLSIMGGVTAMEATALAAGLAAFARAAPSHRRGAADVSAVSTPVPPSLGCRLQSTPGGSGGGWRRGEGGRGRRPPQPSSHQSTASSPAVSAPPLLQRQQQQRRAGAVGTAPSSPSTPAGCASAPASRWRLRGGGVMWLMPRTPSLPYAAATPSSPPPRRVSPAIHRASASSGLRSLHVTLELHRLDEGTAAVLRDGLRSATRVTVADVRLCVSTAEARRAGQWLAQEGRKAAARHRQQLAARATPPLPTPPPTSAALPPELWWAEEHDGRRHCRQRHSREGVPCGAPRLREPHPLPRSPPSRLAAPGPPRTPCSTRGGGSRETPLQICHRLVGGARQHRGAPPASPGSWLGGVGACCSRHARVVSRDEHTVVAPVDAYRRRAQHASPSLSGAVPPHTPPSPTAWDRRHTRGGRLYSPPRLARAAPALARARLLTPVPAHVSSAASRVELEASSASSWSSRSSSPLPRRPPPPAEASRAGDAHARRMPMPRTPPEPAGAACVARRGLCRLGAATPPHQPRSSPLRADGICAPRYCVRRGRGGPAHLSGPHRAPTPPGPSPRCRVSVRRSSSAESRCSCFVCRLHRGGGSSPSPRQLSPSSSTAAAPVSTRAEGAMLAVAALAARALQPPRPPSPHAPRSVPSSPAASPAAAHAGRHRCKSGGLSGRGRSDTGASAVAAHSATASVNGITPPRRSRANETGLRVPAVSPSSSSASLPPPSLPRRSCSARTSHSSAGVGARAGPLDEVHRHAEAHHVRVSHTQLPPSPASPADERPEAEAGYVVYGNSFAFLRARVAEINRHVVWHQVQSTKAAEAHARRLAELEASFADHVTEELTDMLMVLTDMEHGSRVDAHRR
ncbi:hypothetical protein NESM_000769800 [Novymonas esmeraldas]|uniref:Uncharacterized protein n=1 Tax=Novymonas esmeraldas TaxID=1808958 RepID=A0AAW0EVH1_9TRYP